MVTFSFPDRKIVITSKLKSPSSPKMTLEKEEKELVHDENPNTESDQDEAQQPMCPLFMEGLPADFSTNPALAALASFLQEDDEPRDALSRMQKEVQQQQQQSSGGGSKVRAQRRINRRQEPYCRPRSISNQKNSAAVGEATLFMNMWKL